LSGCGGFEESVGGVAVGVELDEECKALLGGDVEGVGDGGGVGAVLSDFVGDDGEPGDGAEGVDGVGMVSASRQLSRSAASVRWA